MLTHFASFVTMQTVVTAPLFRFFGLILIFFKREIKLYNLNLKCIFIHVCYSPYFLISQILFAPVNLQNRNPDLTVIKSYLNSYLDTIKYSTHSKTVKTRALEFNNVNV